MDVMRGEMVEAELVSQLSPRYLKGGEGATVDREMCRNQAR